MNKIPFQNGTMVNAGYVEIDGQRYPVTEPEYSGTTPLSAQNLNTLQDNVEDAIDNLQTLPSGGTQGQVLTKQSATEGDADWETIQALPSGGTTGQVLTKQSSTDGDADWESIETNEVYIGDEQDAPESVKLFVDSNELANLGSEVVNSLSGNEETKAPSVKAVNDELNDINTELNKLKSQGSEADLDTLITTGNYYCGGTNANLPLAGYSVYLQVYALNNNYVLQRATRVSSNATNFVTHERQHTTNGWTTWKQVY